MKSGEEKSRREKVSGQFWRDRCRRTPIWREAHVQVKIYKTHTIFGPLLEDQMPKKCTPLWPEAHVHVKMHKAHHSRTTFRICLLSLTGIAYARQMYVICLYIYNSTSWYCCPHSVSWSHKTTLHEVCTFRFKWWSRSIILVIFPQMFGSKNNVDKFPTCHVQRNTVQLVKCTCLIVSFCWYWWNELCLMEPSRRIEEFSIFIKRTSR